MAKRSRLDAASASGLLEETMKLDQHPSKLLKGLNRLRLSQVFCDVVLICGGQEFPCHKVVLASVSSYFQAMFTTAMLESTQERVNVDGVEAEVVDMLVHFAYTSEVTVSPANVQVLLAGANFMDVTDVQDACCDYMEQHMNIHNCMEIHLLADKYSCRKLEESSMDFILEYFSVIYKQEDFLSISADKLTEILSSDHLNVPEENMVFDAALLWLNKRTERRQSFDKVLEHVRLPLIGPSHLHSVMESLDVMKEESQSCQRFISEAKTYQRLISETEKEKEDLLSYRSTARPRRTTVIVTVGRLSLVTIDYPIESFNPRTKQWDVLTGLRSGGKGSSIVASAIGTVLYEAGGRNRDGSFDNSVWRCDLNRIEWWQQMAPMNEARCGCGLVMLGVYLFALGGLALGQNSSSEKSVEKYDPNTNTWEPMRSVHMPDFDFRETVMVDLGGLIYVIGGIRPQNGERTPLHKYNPLTGVWTEVTPMQFPRSSFAACTLKGKIYVIGGTEPVHVPGLFNEYATRATRATDKVECYYPETDQWTMCSPMQKRRYRPCVAVMDGVIYILGGEDRHRDAVYDFEKYCDATDTWETDGQMPDEILGRYYASCMSVRLRNDARW